MSIIETITDVNNAFLSRREITCNFAGLAGKLKKLEAVNMITKEFKLDGRFVIPIRLQTHVGKPTITGTFFVYDDEVLAKKHVNPTVFSRMEKIKAKEAEEAEAAAKEEKPAEDTAAAKGDGHVQSETSAPPIPKSSEDVAAKEEASAKDDDKKEDAPAKDAKEEKPDAVKAEEDKPKEKPE